MSLNTIREVTEITGITVNALRYYDRKGVLHPTVRNSDGRKEWLYDDEAIRRAKKVLLLRKIGLPVESIVPVIEEVGEMDENVLRARLEKLKEEREILDEQISVAGILLMMDELSTDEEIKEELMCKLFDKICR